MRKSCILSDTVRHVPPHSELKIRDIIRNPDQKIAGIDATSKRIRLVLDHLLQERRTIQEFANKDRIMVTPVWEFPPGILSHTFLYLSIRMLYGLV
jgi:hypothetical protein